MEKFQTSIFKMLKPQYVSLWKVITVSLLKSHLYYEEADEIFIFLENGGNYHNTFNRMSSQ